MGLIEHTYRLVVSLLKRVDNIEKHLDNNDGKDMEWVTKERIKEELNHINVLVQILNDKYKD